MENIFIFCKGVIWIHGLYPTVPFNFPFVRFFFAPANRVMKKVLITEKNLYLHFHYFLKEISTLTRNIGETILVSF